MSAEQGATAAPPVDHIPTSTCQSKRLALLHGPERWWKPPMVHAIAYPGRFDIPRLELTLRLLARRHSGLRTCFLSNRSIDIAGCLRAEDAAWPLKVIILTDMDEAAAKREEAEAYAWLQREFDPYERPLIRALLLRRADDEVLGLSVEHSLFDGYSDQVLFEDLATIYDGLEMRPPSAFDKPASDAVKFAEDERRWLRSEEGLSALAWWDRVNAGLGPYPRLHLPEKVPADADTTTVSHAIPLSAADVTALRANASRLRISTFMLTAASTSIVLRKHTPTDDVAYLFSDSRRMWPSTANLVAYSANRSLLRMTVELNDSLSSVAGRTRAVVMKAVRHGMLSHSQYVRTRFPDSYDRQPARPYLLLNVLERKPDPLIGGLPCPRISLPARSGVRYPRCVGINLTLGEDGTAVLSSSHRRGMYEASLIEELTHSLARRCLTGL